MDQLIVHHVQGQDSRICRLESNLKAADFPERPRFWFIVSVRIFLFERVV